MAMMFLVKREDRGPINPNALYKVVGSTTGDYISLVESNVSDNGTTVTVTGPLTVTGNLTAATITATGNVTLTGIPTSDPAVAGRLWSNAGVLTVSAG